MNINVDSDYREIRAAVDANNVGLLRTQLLSPPRLGVVVTDALIYRLVYTQVLAAKDRLMNPQVWTLLCQSMSETLIQDINDGRRESPLFMAVLFTGKVAVVQFLVNNFPYIFNIHQLYNGMPLLYYVAGVHHPIEVRRESCHFLVEKGSDPNQISDDGRTSLLLALDPRHNKTDAALLLLEECGAKPSITFDNDGHITSPIDLAIKNANSVVLSALLARGATTESALCCMMVLLELLLDDTKTRDKKVAIFQTLTDHFVTITTQQEHQQDTTTTTLECTCKHYVELIVEFDDRQDNRELSIGILVDGGMAGVVMDHAIKLENEDLCQWLVDHHNQGQEDEEDLLDILIHDPQVSFEALKLLVEKQESRAATMNAQGFYPFQVAVKSDASLDKIFHLLKHSPDALQDASWLEPTENGRPI